MALKPTFEMALLFDRLAKEDLTAIPELWPLLTDKPFDSKRPLEDIVNDLTELFKPYQPDPEPAKSGADELGELFTIVNNFITLLDKQPKAKRKA